MHPQSGYLLALLFCTIFSPGIDAIAWPEPTPAGLAFDDREWSPWPTGRPFNPLERRQESENNFRTCGYLDALPGRWHYLLFHTLFRATCLVYSLLKRLI